MSSGSDGPSFDPRSWTRPKPGDVGDSPEASFDPKSWTRAAPHAAEARRRGAGWLWAVAAAVVVAGGGGFLFWRMHHPPHTVRVVTVATPLAAPAPPGSLRRALTLSGPQELTDALTSAGVAASDAAAADQAALARLGAAPGRLHVVLTLKPAPAGPSLLRLEARRDDGGGVIVIRQPDGRFLATSAGANLVTQVKVVRGQMDVNSFYSSAVAAGVNDALIPGFAQAFAFDFDFQREIKPGDVFEAVFEQQTDPSGATVGPGKLLYVSLETQAKSKALY